jgi:hypothetical protein
METVREKWTDERLDDLNDRVTDGFRRVDERFIHLERTVNQMFLAMVGIQVTGFAGLTGLILTQT